MMWQPVSGCGPRCLPGAEPTAGAGTTVLRLAGLVAVLLSGLVVVPLGGRGAVRGLARAILAVLGVTVRHGGKSPRPGALLVANHVSWLDVVALAATTDVRLVAKHDVRGWPVIGLIAARAGAIFVDRSRPKTLSSTVAEAAAALRAGQPVAVFPEGTTFCGAERGRFRPAMFQAAVDAAAPVVPVTIGYSSAAAAFVGDDTLWTSVRRVAALRKLTVTLVSGPALHPADGAGRRTLARAAQASIGLTPHALVLAA